MTVTQLNKESTLYCKIKEGLPWWEIANSWADTLITVLWQLKAAVSTVLFLSDSRAPVHIWRNRKSVTSTFSRVLSFWFFLSLLLSVCLHSADGMRSASGGYSGKLTSLKLAAKLAAWILLWWNIHCFSRIFHELISFLTSPEWIK